MQNFKNLIKFTSLGLLLIGLFLLGQNYIITKAQSAGGLSIAPNTQSDVNQLATKAWFIETIEAGKSVQREAKIKNNSLEKKEVNLVAKDAIQTLDGGFSYKENLELDNEVGSWIKTESRNLILEAGETKIVKFEIFVPAETKPGEYAGVIAVDLKPIDAGNGISVENRVGARIYITVPGALNISTNIENLDFVLPGKTNYKDFLKIPTEYDNIFVAFKLTNTGNIFTKNYLNLTIKNGEKETQKTIDIDLMPRQPGIIQYINIGKKWQAGETYTLSYSGQVRPNINFNKPEEIASKTISSQEPISVNFTSQILNQIKTDKQEAFKTDPELQKNSLYEVKEKTSEAKKENSSNQNFIQIVIIAVLVTLIIVGLLGIITYLVIKKNQKIKKVSPAEYQEDLVNKDY
jgi:hypothetical protein